MTSVDSLKAFLGMAFGVAKVVDALSDGFQLSDLSAVLSAAKSVPGGLSAAPAALSQYLGMTDEDALGLEAWVMSEFKLSNENVEHAIETALQVVIELHSLVRLVFPKA